jgi:hypothetical protein
VYNKTDINTKSSSFILVGGTTPELKAGEQKRTNIMISKIIINGLLSAGN